MSLAARFAGAGLDWIVPDWPAAPRVHAFFATRRPGPGTATPDLDLGPAQPDRAEARTRAAIEESRRRVGAFLPGRPVWLEQVHGNQVATVDAGTVEAFRALPPLADAAVTRLPDVALAVRVADCLPVLLADCEGSVVGAAHAGWRGLAAGVLEATVDAMAAPPRTLVAWLGPGIGPRAFEVGDDVRDAFLARDRAAAAHFRAHRHGRWLADLPALARQRLATLGVAEVLGGELCTHSDPARFHSWRRDRTAARLGAFVWLAA